MVKRQVSGACVRVKVLFLVVLLFVCACTKEKAAARSGPARRIVSLSPSTTEAVFADESVRKAYIGDLV